MKKWIACIMVFILMCSCLCLPATAQMVATHTKVEVTLWGNGTVVLSTYDVGGETVVLLDELKVIGPFSVTWDSQKNGFVITKNIQPIKEELYVEKELKLVGQTYMPLKNESTKVYIGDKKIVSYSLEDGRVVIPAKELGAIYPTIEGSVGIDIRADEIEKIENARHFSGYYVYDCYPGTDVPTLAYITKMEISRQEFDSGVKIGNKGEIIETSETCSGAVTKEETMNRMALYQNYLLNNGWKIKYRAKNKTDVNVSRLGRVLFENPEKRSLVEMIYPRDFSKIEINVTVYPENCYYVAG